MGEAVIPSEEVRIDCLSRWGRQDERICEFNALYDEWLNQMSGKLKKVALLLLQEFDYYTEQSVRSRMKDLHSSLVQRSVIDPMLTAYCPIQKKSGIINSSISYWANYCLVNSISIERCRDYIGSFSEQWEYVESVVFIDDCAGTGGTFISFLEGNLGLLKGKKIVYLIIHIMESAYRRIKKVAKEKELEITIIYSRMTPKAFEISASLSEQKSVFMEESKKMGIKDDLIMGFEDSQSLIAFYNNTPNNTVGIFGEKGRNFKPIFPRRINHKVDYRVAAQKKEKRKDESYNSMRGKKFDDE